MTLGYAKVMRHVKNIIMFLRLKSIYFFGSYLYPIDGLKCKPIYAEVRLDCASWIISNYKNNNNNSGNDSVSGSYDDDNNDNSNKSRPPINQTNEY